MMLVINLLTNKYIVPIISCVYVGGCLLALLHHAYVIYNEAYKVISFSIYLIHCRGRVRVVEESGYQIRGPDFEFRG